jgi:hypothetical protein
MTVSQVRKDLAKKKKVLPAANLPADAPGKPDNKKNKKPKKTKEVKFPIDGFVNKYGFLRFKTKVLRALSWPTKERVDVTIDVQAEDGIIIIKRRA